MSIDSGEGAKEPIHPQVKEASDRIGWQMDKVIDTLDMYTDPDPNYRFPVRRTSPNPYTTVMRNTMHLAELVKERNPWAPYPKWLMCHL